MKTLYLERSAGSVRDGAWAKDLDLDGVERIVVGTGPGSFAGIRSAIAFAQGYRLGSGVEVLGLPSACAAAMAFADSAERNLAVVGDARQGKRWIGLFEKGRMVREIFQVSAEELGRAVPDGYGVASPDDRRIGAELAALFGGRYLGEALPNDARLGAYAEAHPEVLVREPLPIYLNPAVRS